MTNLLPVRTCAAALLVLSAVFAGSAAQEPTASITGRITDGQRLGLPGVTVTIESGDQRRESITRIDGRFELASLRPGTYTLTAELAGFRTVRRTIRVRAPGVATQDVSMRLCGSVVVVSSQSSETSREAPPEVSPYIDAGVPARSDVVADLVIVSRGDDQLKSDHCRRVYRAWMLRTLSRPRYGGPTSGTVNLLLGAHSNIEPGKEYVVWLSWRTRQNTFDSEGMLQQVEDGQVKAGENWYSVEDLFKTFEHMWPKAVH